MEAAKDCPEEAQPGRGRASQEKPARTGAGHREAGGRRAVRGRQEADGTFVKEELADKQPPQLLFIERCFQLLRDGGRMGIVLLESIFGMPKYQYVVNYIQSKAKILAVVTLPEDLFQPHTHAKCCVLICQKYNKGETFETCADYDVFMSDVKWCGHDSRGNVTYTYTESGEKVVLDEIPLVADKYAEMR